MLYPLSSALLPLPSTHFFQLLVHFSVVFIILDELDDERAVREREQLGVLLSVAGLDKLYPPLSPSCSSIYHPAISLAQPRTRTPIALYCFEVILVDNPARRAHMVKQSSG